MKFCQIKATEARLSTSFLEQGLPALLAYKNNTLLGNFIRVSDTLGNDFYANDVASFLKSYGVLPEKDVGTVDPHPDFSGSNTSDED